MATRWVTPARPAVMVHSVGNIVAVRGLDASLAEPEVVAYAGILYSSLPLGALAIALLRKTAPSANVVR